MPPQFLGYTISAKSAARFSEHLRNNTEEEKKISAISAVSARELKKIIIFAAENLVLNHLNLYLIK